MRFNALKNNFGSGFIGPAGAVRTDRPEIGAGCSTLENFLITQSGSAVRRGGTYLSGTVNGKSTVNDVGCPFYANAVYLVPFKFSNTDAYMFAFGIGFSSANIHRVASRGPAFDVSHTMTVAYGTPDSQSDFEGFFENESDVQSIPQRSMHYVQSGDVLMILSKENIFIIVRTSYSATASTFTIYRYSDYFGQRASLLGMVDYRISSFPFTATNIDAGKSIAITPAGTVTLGNTYTFDYSGFDKPTLSSKVIGIGQIWNVTDSTNSSSSQFIVLTHNASTCVFTAKCISKGTVAATVGTTTLWQRSLWWDGNYPTIAAFFNNRLVFAGIPLSPDTLFFSQSSAYTTFLSEIFSGYGASSGFGGISTSTYALAFQATVPSTETNTIKWFSSRKMLFFGTTDGEYSISSASSSYVFYGSNYNIQKMSCVGSSSEFSCDWQNYTFYVGLDGKSLQALRYDFYTDSYVSVDTLTFCDTLLDPSRYGVQATSGVLFSGSQSLSYSELSNIKKIVFDRILRCAWFITNAGQLYSLSFNVDTKVVAPALHRLGGTNLNYQNTLNTLGDSTSSKDTDSPWTVWGAEPSSFKVRENATDAWTIITPDGPCLTIDLAVTYLNSLLSAAGVTYVTAVKLTDRGSTDHLALQAVSGHQFYYSNVANGVACGIPSTVPIGAECSPVVCDIAILPDLAGKDLLRLIVKRWNGTNWYFNIETMTEVDALSEFNVSIDAYSTSDVYSDSFTDDYTLPTAILGKIRYRALGTGKPFTSILQTLPVDVPTQVGTSRGDRKRYDRICIDYVDTIGCKIGSKEADLQELVFRDPSTAMDTDTEKFSGQKEVAIECDFDVAPEVLIKQEDQLPCHISCVTLRGQTYAS